MIKYLNIENQRILKSCTIVLVKSQYKIPLKGKLTIMKFDIMVSYSENNNPRKI